LGGNRSRNNSSLRESPGLSRKSSKFINPEVFERLSQAHSCRRKICSTNHYGTPKARTPRQAPVEPTPIEEVASEKASLHEVALSPVNFSTGDFA